jgi:hypothetical protein
MLAYGRCIIAIALRTALLVCVVDAIVLLLVIGTIRLDYGSRDWSPIDTYLERRLAKFGAQSGFGLAPGLLWGGKS